MIKRIFPVYTISSIYICWDFTIFINGIIGVLPNSKSSLTKDESQLVITGDLKLNLGNSFGYGFSLIVVAFFRELLGAGTLYGYPILEKLGVYDLGYENNGMMILPPMALITVGVLIWVQRSRNSKLIEDN